jgi:hypothetical protein
MSSRKVRPFYIPSSGLPWFELVKQFIRNVRAAKTIADERAVVQKESAAIRSSFREESHDSNARCGTSLKNVCRPNSDRISQAEQCCEVAISFHSRRAYTFWANRMFETVGFSAICGQEVGVFRNHVAA